MADSVGSSKCFSDLPKRSLRNTSECINCKERLNARYKPKFCPKCKQESGGSYEPKEKRSRRAKCAEVYSLGNVKLFSVQTSPNDDRCFLQLGASKDNTLCFTTNCEDTRAIHVASNDLESFTCKHVEMVVGTDQDLRKPSYAVRFEESHLNDFSAGSSATKLKKSERG